MQAQSSSSQLEQEFLPYHRGVPRTLTKPRPRRGAHLSDLRRAAGISQIDLARAIGETQQNVAYWEQSEYPPRADVIPKIAKALGVRIEQIIDPETASTAPLRAGPVGRVGKAFHEVSRLPRRQQDKIIEIVEAFVAQYTRKAG
jgi:transcriptional regulator with XRE-family HTH domain